MNDIPTNLLYDPTELERWLDDTSVPLSDDEMKAMSAYYGSESFQLPNDNLCDIINIDNINEGDELEIEYSIYISKNCTKYLNFWNIVHKLKIDDSRLAEPPF